MAKVLLLGGTGAMGVYLAPRLLEHGHEVHITSRTNRTSNHELCRYIFGDGRNSDFFDQITKEHVYDAIVDFMIYGSEEFAQRRDQLLSRTGHYLYLSSYRVFSDTGMEPITEKSPRLLDVTRDKEYLATDEYALAKARQEDSLKASKYGNWTILRPCITYSRNRFQFGTLEANSICFRALQGIPVIMAHEMLGKVTTMTWAGDVATLIARLMLRKESMSDDFNVVTSEHRTWREIGAIYRDAIGLTFEESDLATYEGVVGGKYQIRYDRMFNRLLDNRKVLQATGMQQSEFMPITEGLRNELMQFRENPEYASLNFSLQARMDKALGTSIQLSGVGAADKSIYLQELSPWRRFCSNLLLKMRRAARLYAKPLMRHFR